MKQKIVVTGKLFKSPCTGVVEVEIFESRFNGHVEVHPFDRLKEAIMEQMGLTDSRMNYFKVVVEAEFQPVHHPGGKISQNICYTVTERDSIDVYGEAIAAIYGGNGQSPTPNYLIRTDK